MLQGAMHPFDVVIERSADFEIEVEEVYGAGQHFENCFSTVGTASTFSATATSSSGGTWGSAGTFGSAVSTGS
jgi:hypothetical protein